MVCCILGRAGIKSWLSLAPAKAHYLTEELLLTHDAGVLSVFQWEK